MHPFRGGLLNVPERIRQATKRREATANPDGTASHSPRLARLLRAYLGFAEKTFPQPQMGLSRSKPSLANASDARPLHRFPSVPPFPPPPTSPATMPKIRCMTFTLGGKAGPAGRTAREGWSTRRQVGKNAGDIVEDLQGGSQWFTFPIQRTCL